MERHEVIAQLRMLKLYGMVGVYDEYCQSTYDRRGRVATFVVDQEYSEGFEGHRCYGNRGVVVLANEWKIVREV